MDSTLDALCKNNDRLADRETNIGLMNACVFLGSGYMYACENCKSLFMHLQLSSRFLSSRAGQ